MHDSRAIAQVFVEKANYTFRPNRAYQTHLFSTCLELL